MLNTSLFTFTPYKSYDKRIEVNGPDGFRLFVDNDDVSEDNERNFKKMMTILNNHWEDNPDGD